MRQEPIAPGAAAEDLERYQLYSRIEILALLRVLIERRAPITVRFDGGEDFIVSALLAVNPDFEELVFDAAAQEAANRRLLAAPRLVFSASLDGVRIQFATQRAAPTTFEALAALRVRVPDMVLRLQRRDHFRIAPPLARPLELDAPDPAGGRVKLRVLDISCGGLAVAIAPPGVALQTGELLRGCCVELPEGARIVFDAEVRSVEPGRAPGGASRCGLRFVNLPGRALTALQRYILRLDRERRARL